MNLQLHKQLIEANPNNKKTTDLAEYLSVSEFYCNTIQGENLIGYPAVFLRLQHCTLNCIWCDTKEVWRYGGGYSFEELFLMMEKEGVIDCLKKGHHFVFTGGSPLNQQNMITRFIVRFLNKYGFKPYIEIENECTVMPVPHMMSFVDCWNNSPKLSNSGMRVSSRYKPDILKKLASLSNSWFKFVIEGEEDIEEVLEFYLRPKIIKWEQVVLMPSANSREELEMNRMMVVSLAIKYGVRYTTREHLVLWDKKNGV